MTCTVAFGAEFVIYRIAMKTMISILISFSLLTVVNAQDEGSLSRSEIRKLKKEQEKEDKRIEREKLAELTKRIIEKRQFVIQSDYLSDRYGVRVPVSSTINFVMVDSADATMQVGSSYSPGYNGVGGITVDGSITDFNVRTVGRREDAFNITMMVHSAAGTYDISMMVSPDGNANVNIRSNWPGQLNYHGKLVPLSAARIYKGQSSF